MPIGRRRAAHKSWMCLPFSIARHQNSPIAPSTDSAVAPSPVMGVKKPCVTWSRQSVPVAKGFLQSPPAARQATNRTERGSWGLDRSGNRLVGSPNYSGGAIGCLHGGPARHRRLSAGWHVPRPALAVELSEQALAREVASELAICILARQVAHRRRPATTAESGDHGCDFEMVE